MQNRFIFKILGVIFLFLFFLFLYKIYIPRVNAFGCFDDCFNFMGGYFLLDGKKLYTDIFFNHAPFMAFISAAIQSISHPQNLYEVVLRHRQFVLLFGLCMDILLFLRFGYPVLGFALLYEITKFYVFGDRFLGEGLVVYPIIFLAGVMWEKIQKKKLLLFDFFFSAVAVWFVIFTREPYALVALFLYGFLLWNKQLWKIKSISVFLFLFLSICTLFSFNLSDFLFNVITTNAVAIIPIESNGNHFLGSGILTIFFYPITLFFGGSWGFFRYLLLGIDSLFLFLFGFQLYKKQWKDALLIFCTLGLSNIRYTPAGLEFYAAFHMIVWYGLFLFFSFLMLFSTWKSNKKIGSVCFLIYVGLFGTVLFSKASFIHDNVNQHDEYIINYGIPLQTGTVIADLSTAKNTIFLNGTDDIIYWVSKRYSTYQYSWYTSIMPDFKKYTVARTSMLLNKPPDFYYESCSNAPTWQNSLPLQVKNDYVRLLESGKPSCLWVKKTILSQITDGQWQKVHELFYSK
ncbi:MAG TPA: hypothetical protein VN711_01660 [Candidatus Saccharimonadales bacterium]|nr:hypothetical protein [Candidatus Saccharimonadales bacterium]